MYVTFRELKDHLRGKWDRCIAELAPQLSDAIERAPRHGPCPIHGGQDNFRFLPDYCETGAAHSNRMGDSDYTKRGVFRSGIDVLMFYNGWNNQEVVQALSQWLGIDCDAPEGTKVPKAKPPEAIPEKERWNQFSIDKMTEWWKSGVGLEKSDMAISYLNSRKLAGIDLPHRGVLRFVEKLYYRDFDKDGKPIGETQYLPALLAYIQDPQGNGVGLHRTYIDWEGKADVKDPRKLMTPIRRGAYTGAAVKLYEPEKGHIGLAEGLETALAIRAATGQPVWSTINRGMLEIVQLPKSIKSVDIWMDNDESRDGEKSARIAAKRLREEGRQVRLFKPRKVGEDWNDVWVKQGKSGFPKYLTGESRKPFTGGFLLSGL